METPENRERKRLPRIRDNEMQRSKKLLAGRGGGAPSGGACGPSGGAGADSSRSDVTTHQNNKHRNAPKKISHVVIAAGRQ